jgi:hypothetical protein
MERAQLQADIPYFPGEMRSAHVQTYVESSDWEPIQMDTRFNAVQIVEDLVNNTPQGDCRREKENHGNCRSHGQGKNTDIFRPK